MHKLNPILNKEAINKKTADLGAKISADFKGRNLVVIGILKGSFVFLSDIIRNISIPLEVDFIGASSYGSGTSSSGKPVLTKEIGIDIKNKDVLIVEDMIDTGTTLYFLIDYLSGFKPNSLKLCAMIDKRSRRKKNIKIDYVCHVVEDGFIVGYGIDYNEMYRQLPEVYSLDF